MAFKLKTIGELAVMTAADKVKHIEEAKANGVSLTPEHETLYKKANAVVKSTAARAAAKDNDIPKLFNIQKNESRKDKAIKRVVGVLNSMYGDSKDDTAEAIEVLEFLSGKLKN